MTEQEHAARIKKAASELSAAIRDAQREKVFTFAHVVDRGHTTGPNPTMQVMVEVVKGL